MTRGAHIQPHAQIVEQVSCNVARPTKAVRRPDRVVCGAGAAAERHRQGRHQEGRRWRRRLQTQERPVHRGRQRLSDFGPQGVFGQRQGIHSATPTSALCQKVFNRALMLTFFLINNLFLINFHQWKQL
jgi:hypothetical protein